MAKKIFFLTILGAVYSAAKHSTLVDEEFKSKMEKNVGHLFEPTSIATRLGASARGITLGFGGRLFYNYKTNPDILTEDFRSWSFEEYLEQITSRNYAATILRRAWINSITNLIVSSGLYFAHGRNETTASNNNGANGILDLSNSNQE